MTTAHRIPDEDYKYLRTLSNRELLPNFWTSAEYFNRAGWKENAFDGWVWMEDASGKCMLPPLILLGHSPLTRFPSGIDSVWSDFSDWGMPDWESWFLDLEYIYRPKAFQKMEGKRWMKFRKNVRKWPRNLGAIEPHYTGAEPEAHQIEEVFIEWMELFGKGLTLYDPEVMADYIFQAPLHNVRYLYVKDRLVGLNVWDSNHMYVNYRFCVHRDEPFLNEYLRYCFYMDKWEPLTLVNDGGVCGSTGLKYFKDSLNPWRVRDVHSWEMPKNRRSE